MLFLYFSLLFRYNSAISRVVEQWRDNLRPISERAAMSLADSAEYPDSFTDLTTALEVEKWVSVVRFHASNMFMYCIEP